MSTLFTTDDLLRMDRNQDIRSKVIEQFVAEGLPNNNEDRGMLLAYLNDSDKTIIGKAKVKAMDKQAQAMNNTKEIIINMLKTVDRDWTSIPSEILQDIEVEGNILPNDLVPGELHIGVETLNINSLNP